MPAIPIDNIDDPRIAVYRNLKSPEARSRKTRFIAEGLLLTERLLASPLITESILVEQRFAERILPLARPEIPVYVAERSLIREVAGFNFHRGVLGCGLRPEPRPVERLMASAPRRLVFAVCAGVQDPENVGGIIRTSAALGVFAVLLGPNCADPFSRRVGRTSMGANFTLPILELPDLAVHLRTLQREHRVCIAATILDPHAVSLEQAPTRERVAVLFGSEGFGLEPHWVSISDYRVSIPMQPGVDSLNVSVAAGIFLHHFTRQVRSVDQQSLTGQHRL